MCVGYNGVIPIPPSRLSKKRVPLTLTFIYKHHGGKNGHFGKVIARKFIHLEGNFDF